MSWRWTKTYHLFGSYTALIAAKVKLSLAFVTKPPVYCRRRSRVRHSFIVAAFICLGANSICFPSDTEPPLVIRVGVSDYRPIEQVYQRYRLYFGELEDIAAKDRAQSTRHHVPLPPIAFEIAVGNYDEVSEWFTNRTIDIAILATTPMVEMMSQAGQSDSDLIKRSYLGTVELTYPSGSGTLGLPPQDPHYYQAAAVVRDDSPYKSIDDIRQRSRTESVRYWFVRPYSFSGYILPRAFLKKSGIDTPRGELQYQHQDSLSQLLCSQSSESLRHTVAFVLKGIGLPPCNGHWRILNSEGSEPVPYLNTLIPMDAVIANYGLADERYNKIVEYMRILLQLGPSATTQLNKQSTSEPIVTVATDQKADEWFNGYDGVREATKVIPPPDFRERRLRVSLSDIVDDLYYYASQSPHPPRLAIVFTGGGAKCAYQLGAIEAIESVLKNNSPSNPGFKTSKFVPRIDLVVGTSGGAINALFTAMAMPNAPNGQRKAEQFWKNLEPAVIFSPSMSLLTTVALGLAIVQMTAFLVIASLVHDDVRVQLHIIIWTSMLLQACALWYFKLSSLWPWLGVEVLLLFMGLLLAIALKCLANWMPWLGAVRQACLACALFMVAGGLYVLLANDPVGLSVLRIEGVGWLVWAILLLLFFTIGIVFGQKADGSRELRTVTLWFCALSVWICSFGVILGTIYHERALSRSKGIETVALESLPDMLTNKDSVKIDYRHRYETLRALSNAILEQQLIKTDLLVTTSRIYPEQSSFLPEDLYFYYRATCSPLDKVPLDRRFVSFSQNHDLLLNVIIGSGTVYPIFTASKIPPPVLGRDDCGNEIKQVSGDKLDHITIVDGGFTHNQPLEAAVAWGATHVIMIGATPDEPTPEPSTLEGNVGRAFGFLFAQAQRTDSLSMGKAQIYELIPGSRCDQQSGVELQNKPEGCPETASGTFDFSRRVTERLISEGSYDAASHIPLYTRVPGLPVSRPATIPSAALITSSK
jgi:predicted acylesterase/phospholipase RssA